MTVTFAPRDGGTWLTIAHGLYEADDAEERAGHAEGWRFFTARLAALDD